MSDVPVQLARPEKIAPVVLIVPTGVMDCVDKPVTPVCGVDVKVRAAVLASEPPVVVLTEKVRFCEPPAATVRGLAEIATLGPIVALTDKSSWKPAFPPV